MKKHLYRRCFSNFPRYERLNGGPEGKYMFGKIAPRFYHFIATDTRCHSGA